MKLKKKYKANELPIDWDTLAASYFQKREFLQHCEQFNPCRQRYYLLFKEQQLVAAAIVYTLVIDLFTFSKIKSPIQMQVVGIPVSVAASGMMGILKDVEYLLDLLMQEEKGLLVVLNLNPQINTSSGIAMPILPNIEMPLTATSWDDYKQSLRSAYRRRLARIREKFQGIRAKKTPCAQFTTTHHRLYLAIMKQTPNKLETLTTDFFQHLPETFQLTTYFDQEQMLCWHITCQEQERFYFFFGGHDYAQLDERQVYFNNLFGVLEGAIAQKCTYLDLGQTAEIPKMRLGGHLIPKQVILYHRSALVRWLLQKLRRFIEYREQFSAVRVFVK